ncbi:MAG: response regulator [Cyanobacteria bacterium J06642_2]
MKRILVVDDSRVIREIIVQSLRQYGFLVIEAANGTEAKQLLESTRPDLVVTDLIMPEMNGYELCRWIKRGSHSIPVVMCSSKGEDVDRYWGVKQGADAYITKPFNEKELCNIVATLLAATSQAA